MSGLEHQTVNLELTAAAWWLVPEGQAFVVIRPADPGLVVLAHIGEADQPPAITSPQMFVAPAVLKIAGLLAERRVWLRASKGSGAVRIDLTAKGATPRPTFGPSPFRRSETGGDTSGVFGAG